MLLATSPRSGAPAATCTARITGTRKGAFHAGSFWASTLDDERFRLAARLLDGADLEDRLAGEAQLIGRCLGVRRRDHQGHADAAVEHPPHLVLGHRTGLLQP